MKSSIENLQLLLPDGTDAALITSPENRFYFTGFKSSSGYLLVTKNSASFITDSRYIEAARKSVTAADVYLQGNIKKQLSGLLADENIKSVGFEASRVTVSDSVKYKEWFPGISCEFSGETDTIIKNMRMRKSDFELEKLRKAQRITDSAFSHIKAMGVTGKSEREIALELEFFMKKNGADDIAFPIIALAGSNTSLPHGVPSDKKVQTGDFLLLDFGCVTDGYHSDMTRTAAVGKINNRQREIYDIVLNAQIKAIEAIKPGVKCSEIDGIARKIIGMAGYEENFGHGLGHGVGLEIHEHPNFSPNCDTILEPGMVISVEPGIYLPDEFGVRIEDLAAVTEKGCEILTKSQKSLEIIR